MKTARDIIAARRETTRNHNAIVRRHLPTLLADATCESCDRPLFADKGDEWEEQPAQDADGVTTFTVCRECQERES